MNNRNKILLILFDLRNKIDFKSADEVNKLIDQCISLIQKSGKKGAQLKDVDMDLLKKLYFEEKRSLKFTSLVLGVSTGTIYKRLKTIGDTRTIQEGMHVHFEKKKIPGKSLSDKS